jgi:DNA-binding NarL/FixJ family response regulator
MNLMIVEDNPRMRGMIRSVVQDLADEISECEDGTEALETYSDKRPDWVLMDIQMKNLNGLAATKKIIAKYADAKIVIVTNFDDAEFRDSARRAGACNYVLKENLFDIRRILTGDDPPAAFGEAKIH